MDSTEQLLQSLTDAHGVPGYEAGVRAVLRDLMAPLGELTQDKLGSLVGHQPGDGPKAVSYTHLDLAEFEAKYEMNSATFYARFRAGEMGDAMDFMEWASLYDMHEGAVQRLSLLKSQS